MIYTVDTNVELVCNKSILFMPTVNKGNNKITELRTILQRESQNS
jgi:hypothetical protein